MHNSNWAKMEIVKGRCTNRSGTRESLPSRLWRPEALLRKGKGIGLRKMRAHSAVLSEVVWELPSRVLWPGQGADWRSPQLSASLGHWAAWDCGERRFAGNGASLKDSRPRKAEACAGPSLQRSPFLAVRSFPYASPKRTRAALGNEVHHHQVLQRDRGPHCDPARVVNRAIQVALPSRRARPTPAASRSQHACRCSRGPEAPAPRPLLCTIHLARPAAGELFHVFRCIGAANGRVISKLASHVSPRIMPRQGRPQRRPPVLSLSLPARPFGA